jgi:hypothetical protein
MDRPPVVNSWPTLKYAEVEVQELSGAPPRRAADNPVIMPNGQAEVTSF